MSELYCKFTDDEVIAEIENSESFTQRFEYKCVYNMETGNPKSLKGKVSVPGNTTQLAGSTLVNRKPISVKSKELTKVKG